MHVLLFQNGLLMWEQAVRFMLSTIVSVTALLLAALPGDSAEPPEGRFDLCTPETFCEIEGELDIVYPGYELWGAQIETAENCVTLLLPREYFNENADWDGRVVRVSGFAHEQPSHPGVHRYSYLDRQTMPGICDSLMFIYVDELTEISP